MHKRYLIVDKSRYKSNKDKINKFDLMLVVTLQKCTTILSIKMGMLVPLRNLCCYNKIISRIIHLKKLM